MDSKTQSHEPTQAAMAKIVLTLQQLKGKNHLNKDMISTRGHKNKSQHVTQIRGFFSYYHCNTHDKISYIK